MAAKKTSVAKAKAKPEAARTAADNAALKKATGERVKAATAKSPAVKKAKKK